MALYMLYYFLCIYAINCMLFSFYIVILFMVVVVLGIEISIFILGYIPEYFYSLVCSRQGLTKLPSFLVWALTCDPPAPVFKSTGFTGITQPFSSLSTFKKIFFNY